MTHWKDAYYAVQKTLQSVRMLLSDEIRLFREKNERLKVAVGRMVHKIDRLREENEFKLE